MKYNQPYGISDPDAAYINGDPSVGRQGSIPPAESIEYPQRELVNFFNDSGLTPANTNLHQLGGANQAGKVSFGIDSGTPNGLVVALIPALTAYTQGMRIWVLKSSESNISTASTLKVNALPTKTILRRDGTAIQSGDLLANALMLFVYDGTNFRLLTVGNSEYPRNIANPVLWVRTDGDDTHDGSANDAGHAFATIDGALTKAANFFNLTGRTLTIRLGNAGHYASFTVSNVPSVSIIGDAAAQDNYIIDLTGSNYVSVSGCNLSLQGIKLANGSAGLTNSLNAQSGGSISCDHVTFSGNAGSHINTFSGGSISLSGAGIKCDSQAGSFISMQGGTVTVTSGTTITFVGNPTFSVATVFGIGSTAQFGMSPGSSNWSGTTIGQRYNLSMNATAIVQGGGANFIPGTVAGAVSNGAQYA